MGGRASQFIAGAGTQYRSPEGTSDNSPAFQRRAVPKPTVSPEGTAEVLAVPRPISRPFGARPNNPCFPGVETPGYSQASLRDGAPRCAISTPLAGLQENEKRRRGMRHP